MAVTVEPRRRMQPEGLLRALVEFNLERIEAPAPDVRAALLSGNLVFEEHHSWWRPIDEVVARGGGDAEDLGAALVAACRARGEQAELRVVRTMATYTVQITLADGVIDFSGGGVRFRPSGE